MTKKMTSRQLKALETKKAIFESALKLFKEKGYDNVLIEDITSGAGTSKGSFYTYFKSKDEVFIEYYKNIDDLYEKFYLEIKDKLPPQEKLIYVLTEGIKHLEKLGSEVLTIVLLNQLSQKDTAPFVVNEDRTINRIVKEIIEEGQEVNIFSSDMTSNELTFLVLQYYKGIFLDWCLLKGEFNFLSVGENGLRCLINGMKVF
ncbi:TetR/AcrR family transcriptional regulator [Neobacillus citreus]|uniref:TetR/AcrR family transcriptional regulator n=1 Tax=Neobacillus citreus TaxID=2833578 RepID=A0A942T3Y9_9BACI|nr:TetR/AcrR family transcriptional regulator [Neobacillus citreus]MCH6265357.1 TetR/AcrR family transcriptional regulator [Neobacillus citreus]